MIGEILVFQMECIGVLFYMLGNLFDFFKKPIRFWSNAEVFEVTDIKNFYKFQFIDLFSSSLITPKK